MHQAASSQRNYLIKLRPKKNIESFHFTFYFLHYFFYCFLKKKKKKKTLFQFLNIIIGNNHVVSLEHCGPLPVMLASLYYAQ